MEVFVDALIYQIQVRGGISRHFSEILPRICSLDSSVQVTLLTDWRLRQALPVHEHIMRQRVPPIRSLMSQLHVWKPVQHYLSQAAWNLSIGLGRGRVWHSTFYTFPRRWAGAQVATVHDMIQELYPDLFRAPGSTEFRWMKRKCVESADLVICVSEITSRDLQRVYDVHDASIRVIHNAHSQIFRQLSHEHLKKANIEIDEPFILYIGSRAPYKGFGHLLQAIRNWQRGSDFQLAVVGAPWTVAETRHLLELRLLDRVKLLTDIDDHRLCHLYNQASALVYPSLYEGFGIPLLEAMACGCPVVASRIPSTLEVARDCPVYFEPSEPEDLAEALEKAINEGRQSERVHAGTQRADDFSWDRAAKQTLQAYHSLV